MERRLCLRGLTRVVGSSVAALARAPRAPRNARVITAQLSCDTELRWDANPEPDVRWLRDRLARLDRAAVDARP